MVTNQKARQLAASFVKKDFYKLLNNSNFGIDYRNNIDNYHLEPIYEDFSEISYIKNYTTIYENDDTFRNFFSPRLLREEINSTIGSKNFTLNKEVPPYKSRKKIF